MKKKWIALAIACCLPLAALAQEAEYSLPMDDTPGLPPNEALFTENSYTDESISVEMESVQVGDAMYHVATVKIASPTQLRTALAGAYGTKKTNKTSAIAEKNNAVVAMNGDYYNNRDGGYVVRQGATYRKKPLKSKDMLIIDDQGDFHILVKSNADQLKALLESDRAINQAFTFGPALVIDGELQTMPEKYEFNIRRNEPRSAIGQLGPLEYMLVVVDGRRPGYSEGATVEEVAAFMHERGCVQAYNLDGGNTATLYFHDGIYNNKSESAERSISDIIYFASAVPEA